MSPSILFPREPWRSSWPWLGTAPTTHTSGRASPAWATWTTTGSQVGERVPAFHLCPLPPPPPPAGALLGLPARPGGPPTYTGERGRPVGKVCSAQRLGLSSEPSGVFLLWSLPSAQPLPMQLVVQSYGTGVPVNPRAVPLGLHGSKARSSPLLAQTLLVSVCGAPQCSLVWSGK